MSQLLFTLLVALWVYVAFLLFVSVKLVFNSYKLNAYLKKNKYQRWRELSTVGTSVGVSNQAKWWAYLKSEQDNDDLNILRCKDQIRIYTRWFFLAVLALFAHITLLSILAVKGVI